MSKHAKPETPLERADRLIWELRTDSRSKLQIYMDLRKPKPFIPCDQCREQIRARNLEAFRWEIDNPLFGKALQ